LPPTLTFWINAFIPDTVPGAHIQPTGAFAGRQVFRPFPLLPRFIFDSCFETDERGFRSTFPPPSSRLSLVIPFDTATGTASGTPTSGVTFEVDCTTGATKCVRSPSPSGGVAVARPILPGSRRFDVAFNATASDPCVTGSLDIALRGVVTIDLSARTATVVAFTTIFPSIEMYADLGSGTVTVFTLAAASGVTALAVPGLRPHRRRMTF
jgi:hypothetical protein